MRLDTLTLKGVLAFDRQVELNFTELGSGLIALCGRIGRGKTTLLEGPIAATYRVFPSREKKEPFDYATSNDSFIQQTFELEGRGLFRARLNLDGVRRKQQAVLLRIEPNGREVYISDRENLADYDAKIAELLPSLDDLLASAVAVQTKRGSFADRDKAGKRDLLYSLFGLDGWEVKAGRARDAIARIEREVGTLTPRRDAIAGGVGDDVEAALEQRTQTLQVEVGEISIRRRKVQQLIAAAEDAVRALEADARSYAAAAARQTQSAVDYLARKQDQESVTTALERHQRMGQLERRHKVERHEDWRKRNLAAQLDTTDYTSEVDRLTAALRKALDAATERIAANRGLIADDATIRAAATELADLDTERNRQEAMAKEAAIELEAHAAADRLLQGSLRSIAEKEAELQRAETGARRLTMARFGEDCGPCEFMTDAAAAKQGMPALREAVALKETVLAEQRALQAKVTAAGARATAIARAIEDLDARRAAIRPTAERLPNLKEAQDRIRIHEQTIRDAKARHDADLKAAVERSHAYVARLKAEAERREAEHAGDLTVFDERYTAEHDRLSASLDRIADAIRGAEYERDRATEDMAKTHAAAEKAEAEQERLATYRREWDEITAAQGGAEAQLAALQRDREIFAEGRQQLATLDARIAALEADRADWQLLAKACGREGLPTLEIDAAGPRLTTLFNDLLQASYGGRFTGELITQQPKRSKGRDGSTHKEVVEFKIYDHTRGGAERDLTDLSGGERAVVEEALRSAIALLVNSRTPYPMRTCFRDETTGSLHRLDAIAYVGMLRRVMAIGGFHQLVFVTHSEDCKLLADVQIVVDNGDFDIRYPPYADAAVH
jgi:DNA repair exonuclease SbcCD ATPase subunit